MGQDQPLDIVRAHEPFVAALVEGGFARTTDDGWTAEMVAAHVARNNECFTSAARAALTGSAPAYDNEVAVDAAELRAHVERVGDLSALAGWVRRSAEELGALYAALTEQQRSAALPVRIRHDGAVIVDEPRPLGVMIEGNATYHLQMHLGQLLALRG